MSLKTKEEIYDEGFYYAEKAKKQEDQGNFGHARDYYVKAAETFLVVESMEHMDSLKQLIKGQATQLFTRAEEITAMLTSKPVHERSPSRSYPRSSSFFNPKETSSHTDTKQQQQIHGVISPKRYDSEVFLPRNSSVDIGALTRGGGGGGGGGGGWFSSSSSTNLVGNEGGNNNSFYNSKSGTTNKYDSDPNYTMRSMPASSGSTRNLHQPLSQSSSSSSISLPHSQSFSHSSDKRSPTLVPAPTTTQDRRSPTASSSKSNQLQAPPTTQRPPSHGKSPRKNSLVIHFSSNSHPDLLEIQTSLTPAKQQVNNKDKDKDYLASVEAMIGSQSLRSSNPIEDSISTSSSQRKDSSSSSSHVHRSLKLESEADPQNIPTLAQVTDGDESDRSDSSGSRSCTPSPTLSGRSLGKKKTISKKRMCAVNGCQRERIKGKPYCPIHTKNPQASTDASSLPPSASSTPTSSSSSSTSSSSSPSTASTFVFSKTSTTTTPVDEDSAIPPPPNYPPPNQELALSEPLNSDRVSTTSRPAPPAGKRPLGTLGTLLASRSESTRNLHASPIPPPPEDTDDLPLPPPSSSHAGAPKFNRPYSLPVFSILTDTVPPPPDTLVTETGEVSPTAAAVASSGRRSIVLEDYFSSPSPPTSPSTPKSSSNNNSPTSKPPPPRNSQRSRPVPAHLRGRASTTFTKPPLSQDVPFAGHVSGKAIISDDAPPLPTTTPKSRRTMSLSPNLAKNIRHSLPPNSFLTKTPSKDTTSSTEDEEPDPFASTSKNRSAATTPNKGTTPSLPSSRSSKSPFQTSTDLETGMPNTKAKLHRPSVMLPTTSQSVPKNSSPLHALLEDQDDDDFINNLKIKEKPKTEKTVRSSFASSLLYNPSKETFTSKGVVLTPEIPPSSRNASASTASQPTKKERGLRSRSVSTSSSTLPSAISALGSRLTGGARRVAGSLAVDIPAQSPSFSNERNGFDSPSPPTLSSPTSSSRLMPEEGKGSRYRRVKQSGSTLSCSSPSCSKPKAPSKSFCTDHVTTHIVSFENTFLQSPEHLSNMRFVLRKPPTSDTARKKIDLKKWKLFGGELSEAVIMSDLAVPQICYDCIEHLRATSRQLEGLFRITGNNDKIQALRTSFEKRKENIKLEDGHDVAGVLKLYLKMLASPLIPFSHYNHFLELEETKVKSEEESRRKVEHYSILCSSIPAENRALLQYLLQFLWEVAENTEKNKMDCGNLAIVFAPSLLQPKDLSPQMQMAGLGKSIACIKTMIENQCDLFSDRIIYIAE